MDEYQRLGHMREVNYNTVTKPYCFLPHHGVTKADSATTKLRVVFDGSAKTSSNISLNDILAKGPTIQDDVFSILLRFRMPRFAFTADIEKMYRQIRLDDADTRYQLIWWRKEPNEILKCFQLTTVTYGTTSAPYLATKCLQRLSEEEAMHYSLGSQVLRRDFYVDDVLTGANSLQTAIETQQQLTRILQTAGFNLRKWCANHPRLLENIPQEDRAIQLDFRTESDEHVKTVGLTWLPKTDEFMIKTSWDETQKITKRRAYSDIARLFDPLGIMGPVIVTAKIFLQRLWSLKVDWDAALPQEMHTFWLNYRNGLKSLNNLKFPRHVFAHRTPRSVQIHVFADASERAYGAAAYIRSTNDQNIVTVRLLCAKSRVAPLKKITLPRLELCAAKLAAELAQRLKLDLSLNSEAIYLWSDSEITLAWINSPSSSFQTFVANRVSRIQEITTSVQWRHVGSKDNPADILSRGLLPEQLATSNLWFYGPTFLHGPEAIWPPPHTNKNTTYDEEKKRTTLITTNLESNDFLERINHKNSFKRLQRITAYILRFTRRAKQQHSTYTKLLSAEELDMALEVIARLIQRQGFGEEITHLQRFNELPKNSPLNNLHPFIDEKGIVRVGGRLEAANIPYEAKHQILLPCGHPLTKLLMKGLHEENQHVGPQTLLAITRQRFWPVNGKMLARSVYHHCTFCAKAKPKMLSQMMGNLPAHRVQPARPFVNCGVDFCGPIWTHFKIRGKRPQKSYIAVFCCFSTKATHLELVTDLTTEGFIGALRRFMGRRGHCRNIYCDNATNFVGAKNKLNEIKEMLESLQAQEHIVNACTIKGADFHFIPPRAPHFEGLWEAAVKSAKHLLQKALSSASFTYEELETIIVEAEAILNSRPITPMSSDPNDLTALTPGHFLIGEPLTNTIDATAKPQDLSLTARCNLVSHTKNEFWRRWQHEYLNQLQHRYKWKERCNNVEPDTMVIIKEENLPSLKWPLGRIVNAIKGNDGLVRVVDVRTAKGIIRRPIHKLAPIPTEEFPQTEIQVNPKKKEVNTDDHEDMNMQSTSTGDSSVELNPPKRRRRSIGATLSTLFLTCLLMPITYGSPISVEPFTSQPGIYFENLGVTNLVSSEWNIIVFYDMKPFWAEFNALRNCCRMLSTLCNRMTSRNGCDKVTANFHQFTMELEMNNQLLLPHQSKIRSRRGAINLVGNIANALFGVLDSQYADNMANTIEGLQQNEEGLLELLKNQTSIIDATINVIKRNEQKIHEQFNIWNEHINHITTQVNHIKEEFYQEKLSVLFTSFSMQAMMTASNFQRIQGFMLDVLADTHHGKISPQLITPDQLRQELSKIKNHLPSSLRLPASQDDILQFYNLMTIEGRAASGYIIFKLNLPLLALEEFELFAVTPVPVLSNGSSFIIEPSFPYLVINLHRDQYYPLIQHELEACISIAGSRHLCKQTHPIHHKGSAVSACEIQLLNHAPSSPLCNIKRLRGGSQWIQLHHPNNWIYVLENKTTINVVCENNVTQLDIEGSGILKLLQTNCVIKQQVITIRGHNIFPSTTRLSYVPRGNLSIPDTINYTSPLTQQRLRYETQDEDLDAIATQLQQINQHHLKKTQANDIHQFTIGYLSLFLVISVFVYILWKYRQRILAITPSRSHPTQPQRRNSNNSFQISFENHY